MVIDFKKEKAVRKIKEMEELFFILDTTYKKTTEEEFASATTKDLENIWEISEERFLILKSKAEELNLI